MPAAAFDGSTKTAALETEETIIPSFMPSIACVRDEEAVAASAAASAKVRRVAEEQLSRSNFGGTRIVMTPVADTQAVILLLLGAVLVVWVKG